MATPFLRAHSQSYHFGTHGKAPVLLRFPFKLWETTFPRCQWTVLETVGRGKKCPFSDFTRLTRGFRHANNAKTKVTFIALSLVSFVGLLHIQTHTQAHLISSHVYKNHQHTDYTGLHPSLHYSRTATLVLSQGNQFPFITYLKTEMLSLDSVPCFRIGWL